MNTKKLQGLTKPFFVGDTVVHKLTGQKMTILSITGTVARLKKETPEPYNWRGFEYPGDTAVCHIVNLIRLDETE